MASHNYISPYTPDERTRRSVFDAQMGRKPMREVYERDVQKPEFNEEAFSNALTTITVVIQGLCFEGAEGWDEVQRLLPARPRVSIRLFGGPAIAPIYSGSDRAVCHAFFSFLFE